MSGKVVYEVEITGPGKAVTALQEVEKTLAMGGTEAAGKFGNALKAVSRDIDVIGGDLTAKVAKGMSDVLGIVEAVGTGGILGPIAVVSAAVGGIVTLVRTWREEEEAVAEATAAAARAQETALQNTETMIRAITGALLDQKKVDTDASLEAMRAELQARSLVQVSMVAEIGAIEATVRARARSKDDEVAQQKASAEGIKKLAALEKFEADSVMLEAKIDAAERSVIAQKESDLKEKLEREADAAREKRQKERAARRKADAEAQGQYERAQMEKANQLEGTIMAEQEKDAQEDRRRQQESTARYEELTAEDNRKRDEDAVKAADLVTASLKKRTEAERKLAEQIEERQQKQNQADAASLQSAVVNESYAASVMVVSAAMGPLNAHLAKFGTINRENWRDLLLFTEDSKAAFAAQVQAALWSLAQQAGGKATMEAAEAVKETALSLGSYAIYDYAGAGLHAASAATHTVAAQVYAGIAGTSAGASVGIGMARGEGGLVGLTKEEREAKDREIGTRTAGDSAGGPVAGVGRSERAGPVVVNFVYEAGAINAQNRDAAAATVASATRHARRDGFRRREMGG